MTDKTHAVVKEPTIDIRHLADYMASSERKRRTIVEGCKYRPLARVLQHQEAQAVIANALSQNVATKEMLESKAAAIKGKLATDAFDALINEANADYVKQFAEVLDEINLPGAEILPGKKFPYFPINGVKIRFRPNLMLRRLTKTNKLKRGAVMFRYAKNKTLAVDVGGYQSAGAFGLLGMSADENGAEPEKALCITLCAVSGECYRAPSDSVSIFANMKAACQTIAERWPNIPPPKNAIL